MEKDGRCQLDPEMLKTSKELIKIVEDSGSKDMYDIFEIDTLKKIVAKADNYEEFETHFRNKRTGTFHLKDRGQRTFENLERKIDTVAGPAEFVRTETEDSEGRWNDDYNVRDGFYVLHRGREHHIYKVKN